MPARKRIRKSPKKNYKLHLIAIIFLIFGLLIIFLLKTRSWIGDAKLTLVINNSEDLYVAVFDPVADDITTVKIPGSVEVDVSRRLGKIRLVSIWQLGKDEKLDGRLLAETITKNFRIPVVAWADSQALGFIDKGNVIQALISSYKTNLTLSDKLRLFFFTLGVKEFKRTDLDLSKTSFLKAKKLADGEMGYVVTDIMPQKLIVIASDNLVSKQDLKVILTNASGDSLLSEKVGKIVESLGTKIAAIDNLKEEDFDCVVKGKDLKLDKRFALVLGCEVSKDTSGNFDVEIKFGKKFLQRF
ncbi:hypothetical protein A2W13_03390 [Candidatus Woesebacteria bacterium RBG_16_36_11]|uniref:LytR/CpsA/Psr regulator C-terminal domain-containing protein n=2 Tax=Candidatus Woeseibacteriota TaxID=1752722 RepID=A0A1F7XBV3_9BACT|nr:MAG: hypothetical protein A2Z67_00470 [Candidatus Woesebacteria bacterium RBG_13_36_22]OGM12500.1 MAG: hypothetical protein A2W13_03390 [Candidatus Woesebacteria bacterium RBG_16_36_11]